MMEIGIYGGTFDPVHIGHAVVGSYVAQFGGVDEVWMLVSPLNPLKDGQRRLFTDCQRLEMARLAMAGCPRVRVSGFEMSLPVPSYTYGTLCALRDSYPEHSFRLVAGADNLRDFRLWRNPGGILREFGLRNSYPEWRWIMTLRIRYAILLTRLLCRSRPLLFGKNCRQEPICVSSFRMPPMPMQSGFWGSGIRLRSVMAL